VPRAAGLGALAALFLAALALRPQLVGIGPLLPRIEEDLAVSHAVAGLLATVPVLCMGLFAPTAPYLSGRIGTRYGIAACLALLAVFGAARAVAPGALLVILLTFPVGMGIALAGALLPVAVKERFPYRPAFATGVYATAINLGSAIASALAVPIALATGGWRGTLAVFAGFAAGLLVAWIVLTRREPRFQRADARPPRLPFRSGVAWVLAAIFGLLGIIFYGLNSWLADSFVERGWTETRAGALVAVMNAAAIPAGLLVTWLADRAGSRRLYLVTASATMLLGVIGLAAVPNGAWVWATLVGMANGTLFPLILTLPLDVAEHPAQVGAVVGLMLGFGYVLAAVSPFALGAIRDATGSFTAALWAIAAAGAVLLVACLPLSRERLGRGVAVGHVA
jgi:CP family cyanate transporter-like MFS transporter